MSSSSEKKIAGGRVGRWIDPQGVDHKDRQFFEIALNTSPEQEMRDLEREADKQNNRAK